MGARPFSVDVERLGPAVVVAPRGELDIATCPAVREALGREDPGPVILDLREVDFMDTSGLHLIVELRRDAPDLAVVRGQAVQRLLDIAGMTPHLRMVDSPEDGLADGDHAAG